LRYSVFIASAALLVGGSLLAVGQASAFPAVPLAANPDSGIVMVLCKYGTPHCINNPRPALPEVGGAQWPDSGWEDPDCKYYGNCNPGPDNWGDPAARKRQTGTLRGLTGRHSSVGL